jgi:hypothetical protein
MPLAPGMLDQDPTGGITGADEFGCRRPGVSGGPAGRAPDHLLGDRDVGALSAGLAPLVQGTEPARRATLRRRPHLACDRARGRGRRPASASLTCPCSQTRHCGKNRSYGAGASSAGAASVEGGALRRPPGPNLLIPSVE